MSDTRVRFPPPAPFRAASYGSDSTVELDKSKDLWYNWNMTTVYTEIEGLPVPPLDMDWEKHLALEAEYVQKVKEYAAKHGKGPFAGREVGFPVADGYARYVVLSLSPCKLIHLAVGDAWHFQYIERLTGKDIRKKIESADAVNRLFGRT